MADNTKKDRDKNAIEDTVEIGGEMRDARLKIGGTGDVGLLQFKNPISISLTCGNLTYEVEIDELELNIQ